MLYEGIQITLTFYIIHLVLLLNLCNIDSTQLEFKPL